MSDHVTRTLLLREHSPMHKLLSQIPHRIHRGMMGYDLSMTCVAAHTKYLAIGVNAGLVGKRFCFVSSAMVLVH